MELKLHELKPAPNSRKKPKRKGRGNSSGLGKTAGRGTKGQNARSGGGTRPGFEGGQTVIYRRIPKKGFKSLTKNKYTIVTLEQINKIEQAEITLDVLKIAKVVKKTVSHIKVLSNGTLTTAKTIYAHKFSEQAIAEITKIGGKAEVI